MARLKVKEARRQASRRAGDFISAPQFEGRRLGSQAAMVGARGMVQQSRSLIMPLTEHPSPHWDISCIPTPLVPPYPPSYMVDAQVSG